MIQRDKLFDENLEHIGDTLHQAPGANTVRAETALEIGAHLTLEKNVEKGQDCIEQHQPYSDEQTFEGHGSPFGDVVREERMKPGGSY